MGAEISQSPHDLAHVDQVFLISQTFEFESAANGSTHCVAPICAKEPGSAGPPEGMMYNSIHHGIGLQTLGSFQL